MKAMRTENHEKLIAEAQEFANSQMDNGTNPSWFLYHGALMGIIHSVSNPPVLHEESKDCWCGPTLSYKDDKNGNEVWSHKGPEELDN